MIFLNDGTDEVDDQVSAACPEALNSSLYIPPVTETTLDRIINEIFYIL